MRSALQVWVVLLLGGVGLALVAAAGAAGPLRHAQGDQAALALAVVALSLAAPAGLARLWQARREAALGLLTLALLGLLGGLAFSGSRLLSPGRAPRKRSPQPTTPVPTRAHGGGAGGLGLHWTVSPWLAGGLLAALALVAAAALVVVLRRGRGEAAAVVAAPIEPEPEPPPELLYSLLEDTLEDLRAAPDARAAVIAAYARMERGLAALGLRRRPSEAPLEYLERALGRLSVSAPAARRLTDLFERGKFSSAPVDARMRDDAVAALEAIRDEVGTWVAAG